MNADYSRAIRKHFLSPGWPLGPVMPQIQFELQIPCSVLSSVSWTPVSTVEKELFFLVCSRRSLHLPRPREPVHLTISSERCGGEAHFGVTVDLVCRGVDSHLGELQAHSESSQEYVCFIPITELNATAEAEEKHLKCWPVAYLQMRKVLSSSSSLRPTSPIIIYWHQHVAPFLFQKQWVWEFRDLFRRAPEGSALRHSNPVSAQLALQSLSRTLCMRCVRPAWDAVPFPSRSLLVLFLNNNVWKLPLSE